jgi:hypothetical protein
MISQQLLNELKIIIKEDYGKELEMKEIALIAEHLVSYFNLLAKIQHRINIKNEQNYDVKNTDN